MAQQYYTPPRTLSDDSLGMIVKYAETMIGDRTSWENIWQDCSDYILPRRSLYTEKFPNPQKQVGTRIYDSTAVWANEQLAGGLHSNLTSPTDLWFRIRFKDEELNDDEEVAEWLEDCEKRMYSLFNSERSGFNLQIHETYLDLGAVGTAVMMIEENFDPRFPAVRFCNYPLAQSYIDENAYGIVDVLVRPFTMKARQAIQLFGPIKELDELLTTKPMTDIEFLQIIMPREDFQRQGISSQMRLPFASYTVLRKPLTLVKESGYHEFPGIAPRFTKITGEKYGRGPGISCLPDIKMVNEMAKTVLKAGQKAVDPPLQLPDEGFLLPIKTSPGGLNFFNGSLDDANRISPLPIGGDLNIGLELMDSRRQHIMRAFFLDWMQLQEGPEMTATEVMQRTEDRMRLMSPSIARLRVEMLDPLIERVFGIMFRRRLLREPPQIIKNQPLDMLIEYVSPVAKAQKRVQALGFARMMELLNPLFEKKPEMLDNFNPDGTVRFMGDMFDVPSDVLYPQTKVDENRKAIAEQQRADAQTQTDNIEADTAQKGAKAMSLIQGGKGGNQPAKAAR